MSIDTQKQIRENTLELQEFLKDLKQWESKVKEKEKTLKSQVQENVSDKPPIRGRREVTRTPGNRSETSQPKPVANVTKDISNTAAQHTYDYFHDKWDKFDVDAALRAVDEGETSAAKGHEEKKKMKKAEQAQHASPNSISSSQNKSPMYGDLRKFQSACKPSSVETFCDANSEKELGNKYFKEKKFVQAIECYARSIALQPSAVAYANRAMAYIKIRRFKEAESDCTEALALDDRYVKAYSRRATARKELGNYAGAVEDAEFALRLEPETKELIQQYSEAKGMFEKSLDGKRNDKKHSVPIEEIKSEEAFNPAPVSEEAVSNAVPKSKEESVSNVLKESPTKTIKQSHNNRNTDIASAQTLAAQAAAARAVTPTIFGAPKTFYEFESVWKNLAANPAQQADVLKVMKPTSLPNIFKDNLSPKLFSEIIRRLEHFFPENADQAVEILENLTQSKRFNLTVMCLSRTDKSDIRELWDKVFVNGDVEESRINTLNSLRQKYRL